MAHSITKEDVNHNAVRPYAEIEYANYRAGGTDQLSISVSSIQRMAALLGDEVVCRAARELNLRLMRKGRSLYGRAHCYDLADLVMA